MLQCRSLVKEGWRESADPLHQLERLAMQSQLRTGLVHLCNRVLHPLVRILLRFGVSAGELKSIVDSVYARAGLEHLEQAGERPTYSRLAVITGINRSALTAILGTPPTADFQPRSNTQLHRAARVLKGWYDDVDFQSRSGRPAVLSILEGRHSFRELALRYSGGVYYRTILAELEHVGAIASVGKHRVRVLRRSLEAGGADAEALHAAAEVAGDLMTTLDHNLCAGPDAQLPVRALVLPAQARSLPVFRARVTRRADALLEQVDALLAAQNARAPRGRAKRDTLELGAAVFAICREPAQTATAPRRRRVARGRRRS